MALTLLDRMYGTAIAQSVQLAIEYDPQPPFDTGSPSKAPPDVLEFAKTALAVPAAAG
jgi:cyclohexyl-isocyanide hydratase